MVFLLKRTLTCSMETSLIEVLSHARSSSQCSPGKSAYLDTSSCLVAIMKPNNWTNCMASTEKCCTSMTRGLMIYSMNYSRICHYVTASIRKYLWPMEGFSQRMMLVLKILERLVESENQEMKALWSIVYGLIQLTWSADILVREASRACLVPMWQRSSARKMDLNW